MYTVSTINNFYMLYQIILTFPFKFLAIDNCLLPGTGCPSLNNMANAQVLESYRGALVKIQCDPGYKISGSSSLYCNGRSWNDTLPSCKGKSMCHHCCILYIIIVDYLNL